VRGTVRVSLSHWGAFQAEVTDGRLTAVHPFPGSISPSPMVTAWPDLVYSETRIRQPVVRRGFLEGGPPSARGNEPFVAVSWDQALDLVADELRRVRDTHGNQAIFGGSYGWSSAGRFHHARTQVRRFLFSLGGCVDQIGNYSWGAARELLPHVLGNYRAVSEEATSWSSIIDHSGLVVAFGGLNPKNWQVTAGGGGEHAMESLTRRAAEKDIEFVVISPLGDDAPAWLKAQWVAPRPNTDTAIMLALSHTLIAEKLHDPAFLDGYCTGFEPFRAYLMGEKDGQAKDAAWAAEISAMDADNIRALARRMASTRTMLTASWSLQRGDHGEQPFWALIALAAVLGQIGLPGGGFSFGYGSMNGVGATGAEALTPAMESLPNPLGLGIPAARMGELLSSPGKTIEFDGKRLTYPDIRLVYWAGGNPFHHHQDLNQLAAAWRRPETVIVQETFWTPTARMADIVLPATTSLERNDIGGSSRDCHVFAMPRIIDPVGGARNDFNIFDDLAKRLGCRETFSQGLDEDAWLRRIHGGLRDKAAALGVLFPTFETFWEQGYWLAPEPENDEVMLQDFRNDPTANALATPSGRIELFSKTIEAFAYDDCPPHPTWLEPLEWLGSEKAATWPLHLVTNQPRARLHSQMDQAPLSRGEKIQDREPAWINPADAAPRGINDGDVIRLFNQRGACLAGAVVTARVRPGVVVLATGAWYDPADSGLEKHGNPNVLTPDKGTSRLSQGCAALSTLVDMERFQGDLPTVRVFTPPEIIVPCPSG
jgi:biotin/methionine sulfoxide reductase